MSEPLDLDAIEARIPNDPTWGGVELSIKELKALITEVRQLREDYKLGITIQNMIKYTLSNGGGKISDYVILCDGISVAMMRKQDYLANS